jgi:hypothetical protein
MKPVVQDIVIIRRTEETLPDNNNDKVQSGKGREKAMSFIMEKRGARGAELKT